nr:hypothetical protein [Tanacetum cinerariifolium]
MAGINLIMELLRKNPRVNGQTLHSTGLYSATIAATSAAVYVGSNTPFASKALYGSIRCFLMFYLPLLQSNIEECANVSLHDLVDEHQDVDYVLPLKITVKQILLETSVVTTRRVLERLAVHHLSQRAAWKLIKDVPMSAMRKANRGMPFYIYFVRVSRTTFRGHFLGYAASWLVHVGIECYRFVRDISKSNEVDDVNVDPQHKERVKILGVRVYYHTVRCCSSLISASVASGISATLLRPSSGHSVGKNHTTRDVWFMRLVRWFSPCN